MAFENLNPAAAIWRASGLAYILLPQGRQPGKAAAPENRAASQAFARPQAASSRIAPQGMRHPPQSAMRPAASMRSDVAMFGRQQSPDALAAASRPDQARPAQAPAASPPQPEQWPTLWQQRLKLAKRGLVAWTYLELGQDLLQTPLAPEAEKERDTRRKIIAWFLGGLKHPQGTHTFWPLILGDDTPRTDLFWAGLRRLGCQCLLIFGSPAASAILQKKGLAPMQCHYMNNTAILVLRALTGMDSRQGQDALRWLRQSLRPYVRS